MPATLVLTTEVFDSFLRENDLLDLAMHGTDDDEIVRRFLAAPLPITLIDKLLAFLQEVHYPLAVRSSSLLEDSQYQPFSGVYETFMLANQNPEHPAAPGAAPGGHQARVRLHLQPACQGLRARYALSPGRGEDGGARAAGGRARSMATRFYPDFSGVVRSRNFYPHPPMRVEDGFAAVALGLGRAVVGGGKCLTFSPRYPRHLVQFSSVEDILANSQTEFWALDLDHAAHSDDPAADLREVPFRLDVAEADGTLQMLGSTYSVDNHAVYDGLSRRGPRIVSFAPILKHGMFPLAGILDQLNAHRRRRARPSGGDRVRCPAAAEPERTC